MPFIQRTKLHRVASTLVGAVVAAVPLLTVSPATAAPPPARHCLIDPADDARTVASLMNGCRTDQILELFAKAPLGAPPSGTKRLSLLPVFEISGRHLTYDDARTLTRTQSLLGDSLTFTTRAGKPWVYKNYVWGRDAGAPVVRGASRVDGRPAHTADFFRDFGGRRISLHEYRQLTPGVWIARDIGGGDGRTDTPTGGVIALH